VFLRSAGRRYGRTRLPFPKGTTKTFAGSLAFFLASFLGTVVFISLYNLIATTSMNFNILALATVCACATVAEALCIVRHDNIVVFLAAAPLAVHML
jgi:dolichol kinase